MEKSTAQNLVSQTFKAAFERDRFRNFVNELTNGFDETKKQTMQIPDAMPSRSLHLKTIFISRFSTLSGQILKSTTWKS